MPESTNVTTTRLDRRTVVRTAANALWAVPAIQLATSVPAFAAASGPAALSISGSGVFEQGKPGNATVTVYVANTGGEATVDLQITFTMPTEPTGLTAKVENVAALSTAGWSIWPPSISNTPAQEWTLIRTGAQVNPGAPISVELKILKLKNGKKDTTPFDLTAAGTTGGTGGTGVLLPVA